MRWIYKLSLRLRSLFYKARVERELSDELRFHLEKLIEQNLGKGMAPEEARYAALRELGGVEQIKEECRDMRRVNFIETLFQDLRYGLRQLRRNPGFTAVAIITLALGIGANTAIFSMINGILLRPLPVPKPDEMTFLGFARPGIRSFDIQFSYPEFEELLSQTRNVFKGMTALKFGGVEGGQSRPDGLTVDGQTKPIETEFVAGDFFSVLGIRAKLGRLILPSEGSVHGADPVIVLSYRYWASRFRRDPTIIGKKALVNGHPVTVVGITPKGFFGVTPIIEIQGYLPLGMATLEDGVAPGFLADPKARNLVVLGREKANAPPGALAELHVLGGRLLKMYPRTRDAGVLRAYPLRPPGILTGPNLFGVVTGLFLTLAGLVLLLACVNVAGLLLVRGVVREREMVIRVAVGAGRRRIIRQVLTESLLLGLLGCGGGILIGLAGSDALSSISLPTQLPMVLNFPFDWRVFAYTVAAAMLAVAVIGIIPALRASRVDVQAMLHSAGRALAGRRQRLRQMFVAVQVAGSLALLIVAGLFVRSLRSAENVNLGFATRHILNLTLDPSEIGYTAKQGSFFYNQVLGRVRILPGVRSASLALAVPLGDAVFGESVRVPGYQVHPGQAPPSVLYNAVSPGYFKTLGIALLRGRGPSDADTGNSARVAVINQSMATKFWPNSDPVGRQFMIASDPSHPIEIVGEVKDIRMTGISGSFDPCFYLPLAQHYVSGATLQVRTEGTPAAMTHLIVRTIASIAPAMPVLRVETMPQALGGLNGLFGFQIGAELTGVLGLLGLALAVVGIFGVTSYLVTQRTQEIGIRMALGAQRSHVLKLVLGEGLRLAIIGVGIGLLIALGLARFLSSLLYGVTATDPLTFIAVSIVLTATALLACCIPARRATKVDPIVALRNE